MTALRDFEVEAIRILAGSELSPAALDAILKAPELSRYEYTGCGYFATVAVLLELPEPVTLCEPHVTGTLGETVCSFVLHLRGDEITLECEPCFGPDASPDFRDGAVVVASEPGNVVDLR
ncbi:hypothetical protein VDF90_05375 [Xanthomonas campestris pv. raphani]|uniref:hypothetical protein n=1 Tax=Xanthomonas campestris TaxID=339 RepID=UPI002B22B5F4|nr:hypothetical protein [Xanthomonas campestris]MEA9786689.1 hypothetical protein [Xanthomonas campestris pv. raphani]